MSGFLPDLANWALRGAAGGGDGGDNNNNDNDNEDDAAAGRRQSSTTDQPPPLSADEMRAQRLARMEELQRRQREEAEEEEAAQAAQKSSSPGGGEGAMEVESPSFAGGQRSAAKPPSTPSPKPAAASKKSEPRPGDSPSSPPSSKPSNNKRSKESSSSDSGGSGRKQQRKKEAMLKKVLGVALAASSSTVGDSTVVVLDLPDLPINDANIAEILTTRLSLARPSSSSSSSSSAAQKPLLAYLGWCHKRASEELKNSKPQGGSNNSAGEITSILQEVQAQVVSYAATCLVEPDLFEAGQDSVEQLANCLLQSVTDLSSSITFGVAGTSSSFYHHVVEEIVSQHGEDKLTDIVREVVDSYLSKLAKCDSVLETVEGADGMMIVSALTALCSHRKVGDVVTMLPNFLLPAAGTPQASEVIRPPMPTGGNDIFQAMFSGTMMKPYKKRSGPAIEKHTVLGSCLKLGIPSKDNPGFSPTTIVSQSLDSVERTTAQQRNQLRLAQESTNQFVMALVKAGANARSQVMRFFADALQINANANALRPDYTVLTSPTTQLNLQAVLLKLCEPIVSDDKKLKLIDPGFLSSQEANGGVFPTTGEISVARLGGEEVLSEMDTSEYNPKNAFIPQCFWYCARALHCGLMPQLDLHESLLRHISYQHRELRSAGRDVRSDARFAMLVARQHSEEVALFQPELITDTLKFVDYMCHVLVELPDSELRKIPEDFVSDAVGGVVAVAEQKAKLLRNIDLRHIFGLVVKLLSPKYAGIVRNYNVRAQLGDVLYTIFLPPPPGDHRSDIPSSAWQDRLTNGPFLLTNTIAQESLAPSLLLLYGEVEQTGHFDKMSHRSKISSLIKYLWESSEHRPAFRRITENKDSFIKFANGIMNETNNLISTVMQKLPEIRQAQVQMKNAEDWSRLSEDEQNQIKERLQSNEDEVRHALPLCNKTLQMFGYLNTDPAIRKLFLLDELCPRLVNMLVHVLKKLVGAKGLELKVDNPEQYDFKPKELLRDLCAIFALFTANETFQDECAKSECDPDLLRSAVKTCRKLGLLTGESMVAFESLPDAVRAASERVSADEALVADAPDEFLDEILSTFMKDPVMLPSGHFVDRSTITQHLLNDPVDPFSRQPMQVEDIEPATELKQKIDTWLEGKRSAARKG